ncbi:Lipoprotein, ComL family [Syntrophobacter sp. SbD1]|nr:Lipoprotein, ComL family [Syntrophobacter sp. SbD1]
MAYISGRSRSVLHPLGLIVIFAALLVLNGCSSLNLKEYYFGNLFSKKSKAIDKTAEQLALSGAAKLEKKDYLKAAEDFKQLKEHYPYSKYAILAELKLGDAYFGARSYNEAAMSYEEFVRLHPRNEVIPYVLYQAGLSHFLTFTTVDRDPEDTKTAMQTFEKVIQNFPQTEYAAKSEKQIIECKKRLISHMFSVARHYYLNKRYAAAKTRLDNIVQNYPQAMDDLGYGPAVKKMLAKCDKEVAKGDPKPSIWVRAGF